MRSLLIRWHHEHEHSVEWIADQLGICVALVRELFRLYEVEEFQYNERVADAKSPEDSKVIIPLNLSSSAKGVIAAQIANAFSIARLSWERTAEITGTSLKELREWIAGNPGAVNGISSVHIRRLFPDGVIKWTA
ncbi:hypothetical protein ACFL0L_02820 [Patescibacteria group bacterium]